MQDRRLSRCRILPGGIAERCLTEIIHAWPVQGALFLPDNDNEALTGDNACKASTLSAQCAWNRGR